jgi:transposase, IS605 orfB family
MRDCFESYMREGALAKNQTYRAFVARPSHVLDLNGEVLDDAHVLASLASEVRDISAYATFVVRNDVELGDELARVTATAPAVAGRRAGVNMPGFLAVGKSGRSRKENLLRYNVVTSCRSWQERAKAANGESSKYVSQGWKRTADASAPSYGGDCVNLGAVDRAYAAVENDPFADGEIVLRMVIQGEWYRLVFDFDNARFREGKVALPAIKVENGQPVFIFTVVTDNPVVQFSGDYTIGVDVGINNYATVVVRSIETGRIVYETTLSQRVHSLWNSVRASQCQVRDLRKKADGLLSRRQERMAALDEAQLHREAASRKKRELAILAAQEIADLSHLWDNAVVAVEDLSWIINTMQHGRWNRGELVRWIAHYVSQNGGWVVDVSSFNTSQQCHECGQRVTHPTHKLSVCSEHGAMDRDINAAANVAARAVPRVTKARVTRAKNRKLQPQAPLKTPVARSSLKYPGRDRTKSRPTPKRKNRRRAAKEVNLPLCPARAQALCLEASVLADQGTLGTSKAALKQGNIICKSRLCSPV